MMTKAQANRQHGPLVNDDLDPPSDSAAKAIRVGLIIVLVFFGGLGAWAATAPLNGAVVGNAVIKVEGNRKSVQHLDGGIVKELRVKEGDQVKQGDVLIVLDDSQTRAEYDVLNQQSAMLRATEARLRAELAGHDTIGFPVDLTTSGDEYAKTAIEGQQKEFESRQIAIKGERLVLEQKIAQLNEQIVGNQAQQKADQAQKDSVVGEADSLDDLMKKNLVPRSRILQLQRTAEGLDGQIAQTSAAIGSARQQVGEYTQQIAQLDKDRLAEVTKDLRDTESKLLEVMPRLQGARALLSRMDIRSPYTGKVVGLTVFGVGSVISRGEKILDIVPDEKTLNVEAQIAVEDISDVHPGMRAEVHFTSYKQRIIPLIHGNVTEVSADRLTDEKTGRPYYLAEVAVDEDELAASPEVKLYPGMPATVMVTTKERTALDYLVGPLIASFDHAFRQR
jgi:HlyD family type I secretion membrane fusion protein